MQSYRLLSGFFRNDSKIVEISFAKLNIILIKYNNFSSSLFS